MNTETAGARIDHKAHKLEIARRLLREINARPDCAGCQIAYINGHRAHEAGCEVAFMEYSRECCNCGSSFYPDTAQQRSCSHSCQVQYAGGSCDCSECAPFVYVDAFSGGDDEAA